MNSVPGDSLGRELEEAADALVLRIESNRFLVVSGKDDSIDYGDILRDAGAVVNKLGPLAYSALELAGLKADSGSLLFEMSPESLALYENSAFSKAEVGKYFRAILRDGKGKTAHQIQLREVESMAVLNPAAIVAAGQMMAIQASLGRIEYSLGALHSKNDRLLDFWEDSQKAAVGSAVSIISEVFEKAEVNGTVDDEDWGRVKDLEKTLERERIVIQNELSRLLGLQFDGMPKQVDRNLEVLNPQRINALMSLYGLLVLGICRWRQLYVLRKRNTDHLTDHDIEVSVVRIETLESDHRKFSLLIEAMISDLRSLKPRPWHGAILSEGVWWGNRQDRRRMKSASEIAFVLEKVPRLQSGELSDSFPQLEADTNGNQKSITKEWEFKWMK